MHFVNLHGYEDTHLISREGAVKSLPRNTSPGRILTNHVDIYGYSYVSISSHGRVKAEKVHQLLLSTFDRPPLPGEVARHLDGNPQNNSLENLAWGTQKDNEDDKKRHGTHANVRKEACPRGHHYEGNNLIVTKAGHRKCHSCYRADQFILREKRRGRDYRDLKDRVAEIYFREKDRRFILAEEIRRELL